MPYLGITAKLEALRDSAGRRRKSECPTCHLRVTVLSTGALGPHMRDTPQGRVHCPGSGLVLLDFARPATPAPKPAPAGGGGGRRTGQSRRLSTLQVAANVEDDLHAIIARQAEVLGTNASTLLRRLGPKRLGLLLGEMDWDSDWQGPLRAGLSKLVREELVRAGGREAERLGLRTAFNADHPFAQAFVRDHVPTLVRESTLETQVAIADVLKRGFYEQRTVQWMSSEIRQVVGLTTRQAESVLRVRRAMEGQGASQVAIDRAADRQQARLLRHRSQVIARTETIRTNAAGTQAAWMQARSEGVLPPTARRKWIAGPGERTCAICSALADLPPVGIMEPFRAMGVGAVFLPPAHVACRCTVSLVVSP